MARAKIKRGSTNIDMTAMCDVAFLLLSFFILTTKFKPDEAVEIATPSSVATKAATPEENTFLVNIDKEGRVFLQLSDDVKMDIIDELESVKGVKFSDDDKAFFAKAPFVGTPLNQMNQFNRIPADQRRNIAVTGIPVDTANNELQAWINAAVNAFQGRKIEFMIKGDNNSKYTAFRDVINSFKKNEVFKYRLITQPEGVPEGSALATKLGKADPNEE
jgi:biopolymer transport protein ExbD